MDDCTLKSLNIKLITYKNTKLLMHVVDMVLTDQVHNVQSTT